MKANKGDLQSERICIEKEMKRLGLENQFQRNIIVNCIISSTERMNKKSFFFFFFHNTKYRLHHTKLSPSILEQHKREHVFSYLVIKLYNL